MFLIKRNDGTILNLSNAITLTELRPNGMIAVLPNDEYVRIEEITLPHIGDALRSTFSAYVLVHFEWRVLSSGHQRYDGAYQVSENG